VQHLIVVAHPRATSFTMSLTRLYAAELEKLGHVQHTYDLYRMGFDPVLPAKELADDAQRRSWAILRAQEAVRAAEVLTVIYPLWWMSMPAMMKGYIDRVFARGFAYEAQDGVVRGLLRGRKCVLITLSAAPLSVLRQSGRWNALLVLEDTHVFGAAGLELLEHLHFDNVEPHLSTEVSARYIAQLQHFVRQRFTRIG